MSAVPYRMLSRYHIGESSCDKYPAAIGAKTKGEVSLRHELLPPAECHKVNGIEDGVNRGGVRVGHLDGVLGAQ
ncbi:hypothetical protein PROFUN_01678 [Planoprotostelium fungivorum]|uniref:Uncharacterized protein n=1 Tax=Planoprotostelium fungivorum TaxID=1890364 RepID=A0A2P6MW73_9EUKA|nr:hypothetical protein PROFUN_01678 [Planoprotostelium fungivorum]